MTARKRSGGSRRSKSRRRVRMADVAERAGVSKAVVSAVLNPHGKSKIRYSDETRQSVLQAVDELGYRLNTTASNFLSGRHGSIGLMVPSLGHVPGGVLSSMLRGAQQSGHMLTIEEVRKYGDQPPRMFVKDCVDGIILYGFLTDEYREKARDLRIPIVDVNSNTRDAEFSISFAEEQGAALAAEYFARGGRTRPAIVLPDNEVHFSVQARLKGFLRGAEEHGMEEPLICRSGAGRYYYDRARMFLRAHPGVDCVLLYNTVLATVLYDELREAHRSVPDEVEVIGTGSHTVAYTVRPSLTHLFLDHTALGRGVVKALLEVIAGQPVPEDLREFSYGLSVRYSTQPREERD